MTAGAQRAVASSAIVLRSRLPAVELGTKVLSQVDLQHALRARAWWEFQHLPCIDSDIGLTATVATQPAAPPPWAPLGLTAVLHARQPPPPPLLQQRHTATGTAKQNLVRVVSDCQSLNELLEVWERHGAGMRTHHLARVSLRAVELQTQLKYYRMPSWMAVRRVRWLQAQVVRRLQVSSCTLEDMQALLSSWHSSGLTPPHAMVRQVVARLQPPAWALPPLPHTRPVPTAAQDPSSHQGGQHEWWAAPTAPPPPVPGPPPHGLSHSPPSVWLPPPAGADTHSAVAAAVRAPRLFQWAASTTLWSPLAGEAGPGGGGGAVTAVPVAGEAGLGSGGSGAPGWLARVAEAGKGDAGEWPREGEGKLRSATLEGLAVMAPALRALGVLQGPLLHALAVQVVRRLQHHPLQALGAEGGGGTQSVGVLAALAHELLVAGWKEPQVYRALALEATAALHSNPNPNPDPGAKPGSAPDPSQLPWLLWSLAEAGEHHKPLLTAAAEVVLHQPERYAPQAPRLAAVFARAGASQQLLFDELATVTANWHGQLGLSACGLMACAYARQGWAHRALFDKLTRDASRALGLLLPDAAPCAARPDLAPSPSLAATCPSVVSLVACSSSALSSASASVAPWPAAGSPASLTAEQPLSVATHRLGAAQQGSPAPSASQGSPTPLTSTPSGGWPVRCPATPIPDHHAAGPQDLGLGLGSGSAHPAAEVVAPADHLPSEPHQQQDAELKQQQQQQPFRKAARRRPEPPPPPPVATTLVELLQLLQGMVAAGHLSPLVWVPTATVGGLSSTAPVPSTAPRAAAAQRVSRELLLRSRQVLAASRSELEAQLPRRPELWRPQALLLQATAGGCRTVSETDMEVAAHLAQCLRAADALVHLPQGELQAGRLPQQYLADCWLALIEVEAQSSPVMNAMAGPAGGHGPLAGTAVGAVAASVAVECSWPGRLHAEGCAAPRALLQTVQQGQVPHWRLCELLGHLALLGRVSPEAQEEAGWWPLVRACLAQLRGATAATRSLLLHSLPHLPGRGWQEAGGRSLGTLGVLGLQASGGAGAGGPLKGTSVAAATECLQAALEHLLRLSVKSNTPLAHARDVWAARVSEPLLATQRGSDAGGASGGWSGSSGGGGWSSDGAAPGPGPEGAPTRRAPAEAGAGAAQWYATLTAGAGPGAAAVRASGSSGAGRLSDVHLSRLYQAFLVAEQSGAEVPFKEALGDDGLLRHAQEAWRAYQPAMEQATVQELERAVARLCIPLLDPKTAVDDCPVRAQVLVWHENRPIALEVLSPEDTTVVLAPAADRWWIPAPGSEARLRSKLLEAHGILHLAITPSEWAASRSDGWSSRAPGRGTPKRDSRAERDWPEDGVDSVLHGTRDAAQLHDLLLTRLLRCVVDAAARDVRCVWQSP